MRISCYDASSVKDEAKRCLSCKNPSCEQGCPINNHIRDFIKAIKDDNLALARQIVYDNSNLAFICSIVCPHEKNCIGHCILNKAKKEPINIGGIEAYITHDALPKLEEVKSLAKKVAIVGAGPAGIYAALDLAKVGIKVHIYEAFSHIGGVLAYGIPDFRLNRRELERLEQLLAAFKIEVSLNTLIKEEDFLQLEATNDAVIIACGLTKARPTGLGLSERIIPANKVLEAYNLKAKYNEGSYPNISGNVFVMGAGNVAMDVARVASHLGCKTTIVYRRSLAESPANKEEIEAAMADGVVFRFLENPVEAKEKAGKLELKIEKMELGEPDASGRRKPVGTNTYTYEMVDYLVEAIGDMPDFAVANIDSDHGYFVTDNTTFRTSNPKVYAIGDITLGAKTVVEACMSGKECAKAIIKTLTAKDGR